MVLQFSRMVLCCRWRGGFSFKFCLSHYVQRACFVMRLVALTRTSIMGMEPSRPSTQTPVFSTCLCIAMTTGTSSQAVEHLMRWDLSLCSPEPWSLYSSAHKTTFVCFRWAAMQGRASTWTWLLPEDLNHPWLMQTTLLHSGKSVLRIYKEHETVPFLLWNVSRENVSKELQAVKIDSF